MWERVHTILMILLLQPGQQLPRCVVHVPPCATSELLLLVVCGTGVVWCGVVLVWVLVWVLVLVGAGAGTGCGGGACGVLVLDVVVPSVVVLLLAVLACGVDSCVGGVNDVADCVGGATGDVCCAC